MARKDCETPEALYSLRALARRFRRNRRTITLIVDRLGLITIEAGNARLVRHRDLPKIRAEVAKCRPPEFGGAGKPKAKKTPKDGVKPVALSA